MPTPDLGLVCVSYRVSYLAGARVPRADRT